MPEDNEQPPTVYDAVRYKAMHANIEAIQYLLKDALEQVTKAHDKILYNKEYDAMGIMKGFDNYLNTMTSLHKATVQIHNAHFNHSLNALPVSA